MSKIEHIFLDMDGLFVDFVSGAMQKFGRTDLPTEERIAKCWGIDDDVFCAALGFDFWFDLPKTQEADELFDVVESLNIPWSILTSHTTYYAPGCYQGKETWILKHYPQYRAKLNIVERDKSIFAYPGALLVDDSDKQINNWHLKGGQGYLVPRPWNSMRDFKFNPLKLLGVVNGSPGSV